MADTDEKVFPFLKGNFLYLNVSPSACCVTTWLRVDILHSVVFLVFKYRRGELSSPSYSLTAILLPLIKYHKNIDHSLVTLSMLKKPHEECVTIFNTMLNSVNTSKDFDDIQLKAKE